MGICGLDVKMYAHEQLPYSLNIKKMQRGTKAKKDVENPDHLEREQVGLKITLKIKYRYNKEI